MAGKNQKNNSQLVRSNGPSRAKSIIGVQFMLVVVTVVLTMVLILSLTTAWYTNVVKSSGLTFEAEKWGFEGSVSIENADSIKAYPGANGFIPISIRNDSELISSASITVEKMLTDENIKDSFKREGLPVDVMAQRLYFYVDTSVIRNGEQIKRVYLGKNSSYTSLLNPQSELFFDDGSSGMPTLKWEWVYDVLGYYVIGTWNGSNFDLEEYVRPIVYNYDPVKTTFESNLQLKTIDGTKTVEEFLNELTLTDGYSGSGINITSKVGAGYYPVSVDSDGRGVWIYLCNKQEIEAHSMYDTVLSQCDLSYTATIIVTGQNVYEDAVIVDSEADILAAVNDSNAVLIELSNNIVLSQPLVVNSANPISINLKGNELSYVGSGAIVTANSGSNIVLSNGSIKGNGGDYAVVSSGAQINIDNVSISNVEEAIYVNDHENTTGANSVIIINNSQIVGDSIAMKIYGNSEGAKTKIIISDSVIIGTSYGGIWYNGTHYGTDTEINNSQISGLYAAIYQPQPNSVLTIKNSSLTGNTGIAVKGGTVNIIDSVITGTGDVLTDEPQEPLSGSGFTDTGDGVYLENNYLNASPKIYISGDNTRISGASNAEAVRMFPESSFVYPATIEISGGRYSTDVSDYCQNGYICIGNIAEIDNITYGYIVSEDADVE